MVMPTAACSRSKMEQHKQLGQVPGLVLYPQRPCLLPSLAQPHVRTHIAPASIEELELGMCVLSFTCVYYKLCPKTHLNLNSGFVQLHQLCNVRSCPLLEHQMNCRYQISLESAGKKPQAWVSLPVVEAALRSSVLLTEAH